MRNNFAPQQHDPAHHFGSLLIRDLTSNTIVFTQTSYVVGFNETITAFLPSANHYYQIELTANGTQVTTLATLNYYPKITPLPIQIQGRLQAEQE